MDQIIKRLANLLSIKSIVTLALTGGFLYLSITGKSNSEFSTIYNMVIAFFFGTQAKKEV